MQAARKLFVGGNWKSNGKVSSVTAIVNTILNPARIDFNKVDVVVAPMSVHLPLVQSLLRPEIKVAAQNASSTPPGPYTGEVTVDSINDLGISWVILGHSERRSFYGETDAIVSVKVKRALMADMNVIACIGENLKERESGIANDVITRQLAALKTSIQDWNRVVIAYEPVWAIGTGVSATPAQAQDTHKVIRDWLDKEVGNNQSQSARIIYGGSVTENNSDDLIVQKDIDGFLVGGASLKPGFIEIIQSCMR